MHNIAFARWVVLDIIRHATACTLQLHGGRHRTANDASCNSKVLSGRFSLVACHTLALRLERSVSSGFVGVDDGAHLVR